jgi:phosphoglycerate kinase
MSKKSVTDLNVESKKVIVRVDFNVPHKGDVITDDNRIRAALPTIQYLLDHNAKVILMSHLGKVDHKDPEKTEADKKKNNMAPVAGALQALLPDYKVKFVDATRGEALEQAVNELQDKEVLLIQNTRYEKGESKNDPDLGAYWASLGDLYVSDAFGSVHRAHASTVGIPTHLPSAAGFLIEKELKYLGKALDDPKRPFVAVLGGAKVSDKIGVIENLLDKADKVIVGGGMAYTFYKAMGYNVGTSLLEEDKVEVAAEFIKKGGDKLILPVDNVIANDFDNPTDIKVVPSCQIPDGYMGLDIGPETIKVFTEELAGAKTVFWNGPMGVFEFEKFAVGTRGVADAVADSGAFSVVGGGDSVRAVNESGRASSISHISTGGGASLEFVEGRELPGLTALGYRR